VGDVRVRMRIAPVIAPDLQQVETTAVPGLVIGRSAAMQNVASMVRRVAESPRASVLLQGESGTGKEVIAEAIHALSSRAENPFVAINCAAIPHTLLETELFGVESGAYTDAKSTRDGYISRAHHGTLFLDEIAAMPLFLQAKLLRFLETLRFHRVGGTKELRVDVRIISATNVDLKTAVARKAFREDLFYRLAVVTIKLPPLRERPEDIEPLIEHFLKPYQSEDMSPLRVSPEAMELLLRYSWPGNVRQLLHAITRGQILCDGRVIEAGDLPEEIRTAESSAAQRLVDMQEQVHLPPEGVDLIALLGGIERKLVREALEHCHGNQVQAAALLGISRDQLRYRLAHSSKIPGASG
jgi:two-component system, NtrC family, response regulator AtoC